MDSQQLTTNFTTAELGLDDGSLATAGITHDADIQRMRGNARILCSELLEPARAKFGPQRVHDGFRDEGHNAAVGGKTGSFHKFGEGRAAADIDPNLEMFDWYRLESGLGFDKVILEMHAADVAKLTTLAQKLNEYPTQPVTLLAIMSLGLSPRCIHVQLDILATPRRLAYIGFTGNCQVYRQVPVKNHA